MIVMLTVIMKSPVANVQKKRKRKTRLRKNDAFKYLEARSEQEAALRKEELQLKRERRELDEQKIQLEQAKFDQVKEQMQQQHETNSYQTTNASRLSKAAVEGTGAIASAANSKPEHYDSFIRKTF